MSSLLRLSTSVTFCLVAGGTWWGSFQIWIASLPFPGSHTFHSVCKRGCFSFGVGFFFFLSKLLDERSGLLISSSDPWEVI